MTSSVGTVGQLVAVIQQQLASRPQRSAGNRSAAKRPTAATSSNYSPQNLEALIGRRIKAIEGDDPQRGRKVFRVFLESVLLAHFGEQLINDPAFYQIVDNIQTSMEADADVSRLVAEAVRQLLA
jgi:hypothetical protein